MSDDIYLDKKANMLRRLKRRDITVEEIMAEEPFWFDHLIADLYELKKHRAARESLAAWVRGYR